MRDVTFVPVIGRPNVWLTLWCPGMNSPFLIVGAFLAGLGLVCGIAGSEAPLS